VGQVTAVARRMRPLLLALLAALPCLALSSCQGAGAGGGQPAGQSQNGQAGPQGQEGELSPMLSLI